MTEEFGSLAQRVQARITDGTEWTNIFEVDLKVVGQTFKSPLMRDDELIEYLNKAEGDPNFDQTVYSVVGLNAETFEWDVL